MKIFPIPKVINIARIPPVTIRIVARVLFVPPEYELNNPVITRATITPTKVAGIRIKAGEMITIISGMMAPQQK